MRYTAILTKTPDGRITGYVRGVLNTTVYASTEKACVARLGVALRKSLKRAGNESRDAFSGLRQ
jgi:hypothetical protein